MSNIQWSFNNKKAIVVGGSRGIGKGVIDSLKNAGAHTLEINSSNCDIKEKSAIDNFFQKNNEEFNFLINVAGINYTHKIEDIDFDEWNEVIDTNLRSFYYISKKVLEKMPNGGRIVNISSIAGRHRSIVSGVHYTSSKAGIIGLTKQIAYEVGAKNITVNAVCPSQTLTEMLAQSMTAKEIEILGKTIPLGRIAEVQEVVSAVLFLLSDEASYITGTTIDVNGGQL